MSELRDTLMGIIAREVMDAEATADAIIAAMPDMVRPLKWSQWGNEWDANSIFGTFTVKIDGHSGYYLFKAESKCADHLSQDMDRSTPSDSMAQAQRIVQQKVLSAIGVQGGEA